jgi:hypothetical protein
MDTDTSKFRIDVDKIRIAFEEIVLRIGSFIPTFENNLESRNKFTSRSVDEKSKNVSFAPEIAKKGDIIKEKKKRMNSSIAGARTFRKY